MRIAFYAPFKPLGHAHPSGDLIIGTGIFNYLKSRGHQIQVISKLRARWIYWKPWLLARMLVERKKVLQLAIQSRPDLWFTYHSYYKAPDLLGPYVSRRMHIPYAIFQGIFSSKRRRKVKSWPGFVLNLKALEAADHVFTNKKKDLLNLKRIFPAERRTYIAPGLFTEKFFFDKSARSQLRREWAVNDEPVILSAAMFRKGVKMDSLEWLLRTCGNLSLRDKRFFLIIAGGGQGKEHLKRLAQSLLPGKVRFVGKIPRDEMYRFYSAGDIFAYPGIKESLGMVFLEAQACCLPVVAFADEGIPEVVVNEKTGFLLRPFSETTFIKALGRLISDPDLRRAMGQAGRAYVTEAHDINRNYDRMEAVLQTLLRTSS
jgi:glycosyltransferase involved in cell wall biosynthesis